MRIIGGKHKGRKIEAGKDSQIRPTSDFARQAIFNILSHGAYGEFFAGKHVLDVYCGSGAFGLEALSRGALAATFIDQSREALAIVRHNAERMHETVELLLADARRLPPARQRASLIFIDPPYGKALITPTLESLRAGNWIEGDGLIIAEHDAKETLILPASFTIIDERRYGRAVMTFIH